MEKTILSSLKTFMKKRNKLSSKIDNLLVDLHKEYENLDYDFSRNGEAAILARIADVGGIENIFDVGANNGIWSVIASELFPHSAIHSFEIVPETYGQLVKNCGHLKNTFCHNFGLSDIEGFTNVFFAPGLSGLATCVPNFSENFHKYQPQKIEAEIMTGDTFCTKNEIDSIDFLKIDVEGYEHKVLLGFEEMLKNGKIKIIQFEYGYVNIDTHFLLKDFYEYLGKFQMKIGKIYPSRVDFREYSYSDENFYGPNYLAVHSSFENYIDALSEY